jgi:hypothetical protein
MTDSDDREANQEPKLELLSQAGGESACWAHLLCPECGALLDGTGHGKGCSTGATQDARAPAVGKGRS